MEIYLLSVSWTAPARVSLWAALRWYKLSASQNPSFFALLLFHTQCKSCGGDKKSSTPHHNLSNSGTKKGSEGTATRSAEHVLKMLSYEIGETVIMQHKYPDERYPQLLTFLFYTVCKTLFTLFPFKHCVYRCCAHLPPLCTVILVCIFFQEYCDDFVI